MKKKSLIISLATIMLVIASLIMLGITYGWYGFIVDISPNTISVGDLRYTNKTGEFISEDTVIYPGLELLATDISITNESPIDSQLRVKIEYTKITNPGGTGLVIETTAFTNAVDDHLDVTFDSVFVNNSDYWYLTGTEAVIAADSGLIEIISSILYDGNSTGNDYAQETIEITVTIEVKQNDNVTWATLATYDFSTGYPA